ncbi:MAG: PAS domain-containing protein [Pirellulales bacterium]
MVSFNWHQSELLERIAKLEEKVAALQRHEERTTIALAQSSVGIFDWQLSNSTIYVSPILQDMLGYEGQGMPEQLDAWLDHLHAEDRFRAEREVREALMDSGHAFRGTYRIRRRDGQLRRFLFQAAIFRNERGDGSGAVRALGTAIDVTEALGSITSYQAR